MDNPKVESQNHQFGSGLFAREKINAGEIIAEFDGDIYTDSEKEKWDNNLNDHCVQFEDGKWRYSKGFAVYSNHSCDPNCGIKNLFQIVSMRDIEPGEEITWDYEMTEDNETEDESSFYYWSMTCKCGSSICRKKIGSYRNMPQNIREKYNGFISEWLINKYRKISSLLFLEFIKKECKEAGVECLLPETEKISYPGTGGMMVSGYFDDKSNPPVLACAIGKPLEKWIETLVHESCHMDQWKEKSKIWASIYADGIDCDKRMDEWLAGKKEFTKEEYTYFIRTMQAMEIDCEKRSVEKIKNLNLPIDINKYIKAANSYMYFYSIMLETHKWCDVAPYDVPEIMDIMPEYFPDTEEYNNISDEMLNLYKEKCHEKI